MRVALVLIVVLALSGCFGKGPSTSEMQGTVEAAITAFPAQVGPGGGMSSIAISGDVGIETQFNGAPLTVTIQPKMTVALGSAGDVLVTGKAVSLVFTAYCSADRVIAIVTGGAQYDVPDTSAEARNPTGVCTGRNAEPLLSKYFDFPMIDPSLMTGDLRLEKMEPQGFESVGKGAYAGTYTTEGAEGTTTLTITVKGGQVTKIISHNDNAHLVLDMTYGDRAAITPPVADHRVASYVQGTVDRDDTSWTWKGTSVEGGPIGEYTIRVYPEGTGVGCGTPTTPTVTFDLGDGADQTKDGWRLILFDDGDGVLGMGDQIVIRQPGFGKPFDHVVAINDDWAGTTASFGCSIPAPGAVLGIVGLLGALVARRR